MEANWFRDCTPFVLERKAKAAWNKIPIQQLCLRDLDSPFRQDFSALHQESQTGPLRNPSKPEAWEKPRRSAYSNLSFPESGY
jgi:hypothetical protein